HARRRRRGCDQGPDPIRGALDGAVRLRVGAPRLEPHATGSAACAHCEQRREVKQLRHDLIVERSKVKRRVAKARYRRRASANARCGYGAAAAAGPRGTPNLSVPRSALALAWALTVTWFTPSTMSTTWVSGSPLTSVHARSLYLPGASVLKVNEPSD